MSAIHLAPAVVTIGETMALFRADESGPLTHARRMALGIGGAESNVAVGLARLGHRVAWVGGVGDDPLGDLVLHDLRAEGIEVLPVRSPAPTGLMVKERPTAVTQRVTYVRAGSAGSRIGPHDVPAEYVRRARLLHVTGITPALSDSAAAAIDYAIDLARAADTLVSFDVNYRSRLWSPAQARSALSPLLARVDIAFAGVDEARMLVDDGEGDPFALARRLAALGPAQVVIKRGADGCLALVDGEPHDQQAVRIDPIDTVGAGDAFVAGYLAELLNGADVQACMRTAVATGAYACLVPGDWEGFPRREDLGMLSGDEPVAR